MLYHVVVTGTKTGSPHGHLTSAEDLSDWKSPMTGDNAKLGDVDLFELL